MSCAIRSYGLGRRFRRAAALESLDLEVPEGAIYALLGPPGAGKSTCLQLLLNILAPTAGRAEILGVDSRRLTSRDFTQIGYLAPAQELPHLTIGHFFGFLRGFYPAWDAAIEAALVRQFQLPLDRSLDALSLATRRKAALVSTLAYRPRLILLDEPFRGVDPISRNQLLEALREHAGRATILIAAEDAAKAETFATHIGCLEAGRLRLSEEVAALRARFREIVLTFETAPPLSGDWPPAWLPPQGGPTTIRFIDTRFHEQETPAEARRRCGEWRSLAANPMPVSEIVSALAGTWRQP